MSWLLNHGDPLQNLPLSLSHFTSLDFFLTSHLETPVSRATFERGDDDENVHSPSGCAVGRSVRPSVRPSGRFFSILPIRVTRSRFHLRSVHFPALFSASPLSALRVRSVRPFIVFDQRCEMGSMIHSSLSSSYLRLRNLLAQPEIILGAEMVARPLARIFCPKDLFMFYHS